MQSISEIKEILSSCSMEELPEQMKQFEEDSRKGVQTALASFRKKYEKHQQELARLDEILTYEVDQILIVLPDETDALLAEEGKDLCTLVTCTPYGINTHRLLVRGIRIETIKEKPVIYVSNEAFQLEPLLVTPAVAAPMLLVLLVLMLL